MPLLGLLHFNWIDIVVIAFIVRGVYLGYKRGLSGELLRFLGIVIALFLSFKFYEAGADRLVNRFELDRRLAIACSFAGISLAAIFFFYVVNRMVQRMMDLTVIAALEKGGGMVLGGLKALLFACVVLIILALVKVQAVSNSVSRGSYFGSLAISAVPGAYKLAVRIYPEAENLPAEEVIEKLPAVTKRGGVETKKGGEEDEIMETGYVLPDKKGDMPRRGGQR